jgi:hypothetical protein
MSRRKRNRKKAKIKACIQGRKLKGLRNVKVINNEEFAYQGQVYLIDDFPPHAEIHLDTTEVTPIREYEGVYEKQTKKRGKKQKVRKRTYAAQLYSNIGECADVGTIFQNQG